MLKNFNIILSELPVLVSDIPQHREFPLENYRYFQKGNIGELSKRLVELFKRSISEKEKEKYISLIRKNYNWDQIAKKTLKVYEEIL